MNPEEFIVYACPVGKLYQQIKQFFQIGYQSYGENPAYRYMPHCSLTGFFEEKLTQIDYYKYALEKAYIFSKSNNQLLDINIVKMTFKPRWHGLELEATGVQTMMNVFRENLPASMKSKLRLKDGLHLSFAYQFNPEQAQVLKQLAQKMINPRVKTQWELRLYQKHLDWTWTCHQSWLL